MPVTLQDKPWTDWTPSILNVSMDTVEFSCDIEISQDMWYRLQAEKGTDGHRVSRLLGAFGANGVLPELRQVASAVDLVVEYLDVLGEEAERMGGLLQVPDDHFAKFYKGSANLARLTEREAA
jgi:hypothetical protein